MACVSVRARGAGDPDGAADRPERLEWHAAIGFIAGIAPEHLGGDRVSASLQPGFALHGAQSGFSSRTTLAVRRSDPGGRGGLRVALLRGEWIGAGFGLPADSGRHKSSRGGPSGLGDVPGTVLTRVLTAVDSQWSLQRIGSRLSAGLAYRF